MEIKATAEEIATLVLALQERRETGEVYHPIWPDVKKIIAEHPEMFTSGTVQSMDEQAFIAACDMPFLNTLCSKSAKDKAERAT